MAVYRQIEGAQAGPQALGILVPPGVRTQVILRPRGLQWDLLPTQRVGAAFCEFGRDEAAGVARRVQLALAGAAASGHDPRHMIEVRTAGYHVAAALAGWLWLVCPRRPGQAYEPVLFPTLSEAERVAEELAPFLFPAADAEQEYYFNTQCFRH